MSTTPRLNDQAVQDGVLRRVSPSQIKTFRSCPRKWWFEKVARAPAPRWTAATNLGTNVHTELENYCLTGAEPTHEIVKPGRHLLPERHPDMAVEIQLADPWLYAGAVLVTGFIDLVLPHTDPLTIIDWKTTSNILKYGKKQHELATDVQMAIYAKWAQNKYDVDKVTVAHIQFQTKGEPLAQRVQWEHSVDTVKPLWLSIEQDVAEMSRCASLKEAEVPANLKSCNEYGGCPYRNICTATKTGARNMSLLDKLKNKANPAAAPTPAPEPEPEPVEERTIIAPDAALDDTPVQALVVSTALAQAIVETPLPKPEVSATPTPAPTPKQPPTPPEPQKRKPGRPRKNPAPEASAAPQNPTDVKAEPVSDAKDRVEALAKQAQTTPPGKVGLHLYINCRPDHFCQPLAPFVAEVAAEVAKTCDVPDVRLCGGDLGYNKWKGAVAALAASKAPHGEFWVQSGEVEDAVVSGLVPLASSVVRGVR